MSSTLCPYIAFRDDAREAMEFYRDVFGGDLDISTFGDFGTEGPDAGKVMHAQLKTPAGLLLMASDTPDGMDHSPGGAITISLFGDDRDDLVRWWQRLSDGGTVTLPLEKQVWGDEFGMLTDRFGVAWMVNVGQAQQVSIEDVIAEYSAAWSETDPAARRAMLARTVVEDVPYCDPGAQVTGIDALGEVIAGVQGQFPGAVLLRTSEVDSHHDCIRFSWRFVDPAGEPLLDGIDVCTVADDGRIASFTVFFGPLGETG